MLANLRALFGVVVDIVLLRRGPEHLPASPALLGIVIGIYLALYVLFTVLMPNALPNWMLFLIATTAFVLLWFRISLVLAKKPERFVQTSTAYFAATSLFLPLLVPLESVLRPYLASQEAMRSAPAMLVLSGAAIGIWGLVVQSHIVRNAFEWNLFRGILFILAMNFLSALMLGLVFGVPQSGTTTGP